MPLDVRGSIELRRVRMSNTGSTDEAPGRPTTPPELRVEHDGRRRRIPYYTCAVIGTGYRVLRSVLVAWYGLHVLQQITGHV